jgi:SPX domain protein involved in polyphosphate accumulation/uncharacterized membrane protein YidH (DUF202 family)
LPSEDKEIEKLSIPENIIMNNRVSDAYSAKPMAMTSVASVALQAEIDECQQRLLSGNILMRTAAANQRASWNANSREVAVRPFVDAFRNEVERLGGVLSNSWQTTTSSVEALLKDANGLSRRKKLGTVSGTVLADEVAALRRLARNAQNKTLKAIREHNKTQQELLRLALKADSKLGTACQDECERELTREPWADEGSSGHIVKLISDIFTLIREIEKDDVKGGKWVAPKSFERVTTKYWVQEEDLPEVLLKSASELPVIVYGKSGLLTKNPKNPSEGGKGNFWKNEGDQISSVYFDSENLDLYRERIKRSEGAQLVRTRWYGTKPKENKPVFLELKTHHECWIDNKSVKERVNILQRRMNDMVNVKSGPWSKEFAEKLVREAYEDESDVKQEQVDASAALLLEIRDIFCKFHLKPCCRTSYTRVAFQNPDSNDLRLTIDRDITVIDEMSSFLAQGENPRSWCIDDGDSVPFDSFVKVPYGVFEVKVSAGEDPLFVEDLKATEAIVVAHKFSKFLTGASLHNFNKVDIVLPWWSEDAHFAPMFKTRSKSPRNLISGGASTASTKAILALVNADKDKFQKANPNTTAVLAAVEEGRGSEVKSSAKALEESHASMNSQLAGTGISFGGLFKRKKKKGERKTAPRSPARVEPKSFFANERTFLNWVTIGGIVLLTAEMLYENGRDNSNISMGNRWKSFANAIIICSMFPVVYGTYVYYRRLYLMINAKPYGYSDAFGPGIFAIFMFVLLVLFIVINQEGFVEVGSVMVESAGFCVMRKLNLGASSGISALQFEPSDVIVDVERNIILVASLDEIIALPAGLPTDQASTEAPIELLYKFPDDSEDLEGLAIVDGRLYALSENKKDPNSGLEESEIIALDWTANNTLIESERWRVGAPNAEGLAYTSDPNWFSKPQLLVAADTRDVEKKNRLEMFAYEVPLPLDSKLPEKRFNNKFFSQNLKDTKIASMQFFGDLLYVLYNNAALIRAYDSGGNQMNEWLLPVRKEGFENNWEGMQLEQNGDDLYLHLTLDTPGEIWTLKLGGETSADGVAAKWTLPSCASSFF